jgi:uncharacterized protein (TIGR02246 family)
VEPGGNPSENIRVVKGHFQAFADGDFDRFVALLDEDVDWRVSGYLTGDRDLRGRDAVRRWLVKVASLYASGEEIQIVPEQFRDVDDETVLALGWGTITREEGTIREDLGWVYRLREGRIAYMKDYLSHDEAREAAEQLGGD